MNKPSSRQWFKDQVARKCDEMLTTLSVNWPFGAIIWNREHNRPLYDRLKELEVAINKLYLGELTKLNYQQVLEHLGVYSSILKEMKADFIEAGGKTLGDNVTLLPKSGNEG